MFSKVEFVQSANKETAAGRGGGGVTVREEEEMKEEEEQFSSNSYEDWERRSRAPPAGHREEDVIEWSPVLVLPARPDEPVQAGRTRRNRALLLLTATSTSSQITSTSWERCCADHFPTTPPSLRPHPHLLALSKMTFQAAGWEKQSAVPPWRGGGGRKRGVEM